MCCLPLSSVLISPITGALLDHFSWRTVLFVEGIPPLIWAIVWLLVVSDHPHDAKWASGAEREYIEAELAADEANKPIIDGDGGYLAAARSAHVWQLIAIYLCFMGGFYGYTLWLPPRGQGTHVPLAISAVALVVGAALAWVVIKPKITRTAP